VDETRGTLQFASRAKAVTNNATVNEILTDEALLKRQKREIEQLRARLAAEAGGGAVDESVVEVRGGRSPFRFVLSTPSVATVGTRCLAYSAAPGLAHNFSIRSTLRENTAIAPNALLRPLSALRLEALGQAGRPRARTHALGLGTSSRR
jgi:hypothetical protein